MKAREGFAYHFRLLFVTSYVPSKRRYSENSKYLVSKQEISIRIVSRGRVELK
jgi:hypothetical protein